MRNHLTWFVPLLLLLPTTAVAQGWYLMVPPITPAKNALLPPSVETRAPLSEWRQDGTFESLGECQTYSGVLFKQLEQSDVKVKRSQREMVETVLPIRTPILNE